AAGTNIAGRHLVSSESARPRLSIAAAIIGIAACVTPPPRLPQPAVVALAMPTTLGANMTLVWYCVITNDAPMTPMQRRDSRYVSQLYANAEPATERAPNVSTITYDSRGP